MSANQGFEVYSESGKEILSRHREHRRITYGGRRWGRTDQRLLYQEMVYQNSLYEAEVLCCQRGKNSKKPTLILTVVFSVSSAQVFNTENELIHSH